MSGVPVEVAVVDSRSEADLIVGLLRSNGLRAGIWADDAGGTNPELQMGGVRVVVDPKACPPWPAWRGAARSPGGGR